MSKTFFDIFQIVKVESERMKKCDVLKKFFYIVNISKPLYPKQRLAKFSGAGSCPGF
jgi:hypothetical protein